LSPLNNNRISDEMSEKIIEAAASIVTADGAQNLTVRRILQKLGITNRVFYNRFHNVEEVLAIVYEKITEKIRQRITAENDENADFFEKVTGIAVNALIVSYEIKMRFNQYMFENDSVTKGNFEWWIKEIRKLIDYAKEQGYIRNVDSDAVSYAIWCFCRGYNADAVERSIPKEEAVQNLRYSFSILLDGLRCGTQPFENRN